MRGRRAPEDCRPAACLRGGRRDRRHAIAAIAVPIVVLLAACPREEAPASGNGRALRADGPRAASSTPTPDPASSASFGAAFAGLDDDVLLLPESRLADPGVLRRFAVPDAVTERYAVRWVDGSGELAGPAHVCLALPWLDGGGNVVGREYVLTDLDACRSYADLAAEARRIANDVDTALGAAGRVDGPVLRERTRRSAAHFFTLVVSAWSFQHPIRDGLGGLPFWLLTPERLPADAPAPRTRPTAIHPAGDAGGLVEVVAYDGPSGPFLFSHHAGRRVEPAALGWRFEPAEALHAWRTGVAVRHASDPAGAVRAQAALWTWTFDGGTP
ncbi:MAG: hypothetical protein HY907_21380 [Deltaproteobacteria bacterium]|nr:hypothetical protein [Deltaproteobacteria bacterium]